MTGHGNLDDAAGKNTVLYYIFYTVFKRKLAMINITAIAFVLVLMFSYLITPGYKRTAKVLVRANPQQQLILFEDLAAPNKEALPVNPAKNFIEILTGKQMAQQVVEKFKLGEKIREKEAHPEALRDRIKEAVFSMIAYPIRLLQQVLGIPEEPKDYVARAVTHFVKKSEDVELEEESNVINLSVWYETPQLSADIANFMAEQLIKRAAALETSNAQRAFQFTQEQVKAAEERLKDSEKRLLVFRQQNKIINLGEQMKSVLAQLSSLEEQYVAVKADYAESKASLDKIDEILREQKDILVRAPLFSDNPAVKDLVRSVNAGEIHLAGALARFTKASPNVKKLIAENAERKNKLDKELKAIMRNPSAILQSIHPDLAEAYTTRKTKVAAMSAKKNALKDELDKLTNKGLALSELETELHNLYLKRQIYEQVYNSLLDKYSKLNVQKIFQQSGYDLKIIDKAFVSAKSRPDWPNWFLVIPLGLLGSLLLGLAMVFFVEYWDETFTSPREVEERTQLPVLCTIPDIR